jgi:diguanylate cyclase (GGDEF)-like protein
MRAAVPAAPQIAANIWSSFPIQVHRFKAVNDQHGYDTGDRLLKTISASLATSLGPQAVLARLSGDEFAVAFALCAQGHGWWTELPRRCCAP